MLKHSVSLTILALLACAPPPADPPEPPADLRLGGARIQHYRDGVLLLRGTAREAEYWRETQLAHFAGARLDFPGQGQRKPAVATADLGRYDARAQKGWAEGSVQLVSGPDRAITDRAEYDGAAGMVRGVTPIRLDSPGVVARATRWEVDLATRAASLDGAVRVAATPDAAGPGTEITAQKCVTHYAEKRTVCEGDVTAVHGAYVMKCPRAVAEYVDADGRQRLSRVLAEGGVDVTGAGRAARAREATFDDAASTITMTGEPELVEGTTRVAGERIVFHVGDDTAHVKKPRATIAGAPGEPSTVIHANEARAHREKGTVTFLGNVVARRGEATVKAPRARASSADGKLVQVVFEGGVEAAQGARTATGERAVYEARTRTVALTGNPSLQEGGDVVHGERIVFFADGKRVEVTRATARIQGKQP